VKTACYGLLLVWIASKVASASLEPNFNGTLVLNQLNDKALPDGMGVAMRAFTNEEWSLSANEKILTRLITSGFGTSLNNQTSPNKIVNTETELFTRKDTQ
jgi:hypothetical protein